MFNRKELSEKIEKSTTLCSFSHEELVMIQKLLDGERVEINCNGFFNQQTIIYNPDEMDTVKALEDIEKEKDEAVKKAGKVIDSFKETFIPGLYRKREVI